MLRYAQICYTRIVSLIYNLGDIMTTFQKKFFIFFPPTEKLFI